MQSSVQLSTKINFCSQQNYYQNSQVRYRLVILFIRMSLHFNQQIFPWLIILGQQLGINLQNLSGIVGTFQKLLTLIAQSLIAQVNESFMEQKFRELVFSPTKHLAQKLRLSDTEQVKSINKQQADEIAKNLLVWAKNKGVTHYTFWVQPITNETMEKHDAFFELEYVYDGTPSFRKIDKFDGQVLLKGEGDGSSFPNGGLRFTEEARGYIAWDPYSDVFIREGINKTLYLPAMLLTHTGEALDQKTYLRRAQIKLKTQTIRLLHLLGQTKAKSVLFGLGIQQEFFIIPKSDYGRRLDLNQTGRTLYGALPPRNQQYSDHYYGKINDKVFEILNECENTLLRLGVPVKTKHKEVAVNQYEMSSYYSDAVTSVEHNLLTMDVLKSVFDKHGYVVLFHQKPFRGANGSGKHCNWSLQFNKDGKYENLFEPSSDPTKNIKFILFILITLKAVQKNAGLIKASITSASNQHRMGGHQAPPSIISVFLGSHIDKLLNSIEKGEDFNHTCIDLSKLIPGMSSFIQDNTDRNRTSPFAFTGNKFQIRAVGSKQNVSFTMTAIAAILAEEMGNVSRRLEEGGEVWQIIKEIIADTKRIRFQGNGYSEEWAAEAAKRGLPNLKTAKESYQQIISSSVLKDMGVFSQRQLEARYIILSKAYCNTIFTESETMVLILNQYFLPKTMDFIERISRIHKGRQSTRDQLQSFYPSYDKIFLYSKDLKQKIKQASKQNLQYQLECCTTLRHTLEEISEFLSELETQLPRDKNPEPQLFDMLNKY